MTSFVLSHYGCSGRGRTVPEERLGLNSAQRSTSSSIQASIPRPERQAEWAELRRRLLEHIVHNEVLRRANP